MSQNHSFISYIKNEHSFTLNIFGIIIIITSVIRIKQYLRMGFSNIKLGIKFILSLNVRKIKLTISNTLLKLTMNFAPTIRIPKTIFVTTMKQSMKFLYPQKIPKIVIGSLMKLASKFIWSPKIPKIIFALSMIVAQFFKLSTHDTKTLMTMDSQTLASLDYAVAP